MRYDAEQVDSIAAEYALGTLHGTARRRFERLIADRADVRSALWSWERHLSGLASALEPQQPPLRVWKKIRQRIGPAEPVTARFVERWRGFWLALPAAAAAAWLALAVFPPSAADRAAVFAGPSAEALWVVAADLKEGSIRIETLAAPALDPDKSYELWVLPANDQPPISLGVLSTAPGVVESRLAAPILDSLVDASNLAISLEPLGGSPTGQPTGEVVHVASLVTI